MDHQDWNTIYVTPKKKNQGGSDKKKQFVKSKKSTQS